jgi:hypothetical protein
MISTDNEFLNGLFHFIAPYLGPNARKEVCAIQETLELFPGLSVVEVEKSVRSLKAICDLFPESSPAEIEKLVRELLAKTETAIPKLTERAKDLFIGTDDESCEKWLADVGKLKVDQLKQLLKAMNLTFCGGKPAILGSLRAWVESRGQYREPDPKEQMREKAAQYAGDLVERAKQINPQIAGEILQAAEAAAKDRKLGTDGFEIFANILGIPVKGTKKNMLDQVKDHVNSLLVSRQQTTF